MDISALFDLKFGPKQEAARLDSCVADYCRWVLKGKNGRAPGAVSAEDAGFVAKWEKNVNALMIRAEELARSGEGRGSLAFDGLKKDAMALADEVFSGPDRGIVFGRVAQTFDRVAAEIAQGSGGSETPDDKDETWQAYPRLESDAYRRLLEVQKFYSWEENGKAHLAQAQRAFLEKCPGREDLIDLARANGWLLKDLKEKAYGLGFKPDGKQELEVVLQKAGIPRGLNDIVWRSFEAGEAACQRRKDAMAIVRRQERKDKSALKTQDETAGHPNSILNLKPSKKWVIVSDETGKSFGNDAFSEQDEAGRYAFVLIPESAQLPKLKPGWHAVDEKDVQSILKVAEDLHHSGCGILGIPVRGLSPDNRQLWYACVEALLDLTVRLLPIDGETQIELNVEQRGVATADQNELLQKTVDDVMYHLALVNPERAMAIHLAARFIEKHDSPWNGYADLVAYSWGCGKAMQKVFAPFGWVGPCLVSEDDKVAESFRRCLELVHRGGVMPVADWNLLVTNREATAVGSLTGALLRTCGEEAQKDAALWRGYLDYVLAHLDSKAIRMSLLVPQLTWLKEYEPDSESLPPRLRLLWLTAQLAVSNHRGGTQFGIEEHAQEFAELTRSLKDEDAPLTCFAALHLAVELTDAFRFEEARELLQPWEREPVAVPGLRYYAQVLSSLGQHEAFLGNNDKALDYFDRAFAAFGRLSEGQQREIDHTLAYAVIAAMDARSPRLPLLMAAYLYGGAYTVEGMVDMANQFAAVGEDEPDSKYAHAILLRYLVTLPEDDPVRQAYLAKMSEWKWCEDGHPWELIAFYRAMLLGRTHADRELWLHRGYDLARAGGPALRLIACVIGKVLLRDGALVRDVYLAELDKVVSCLPNLGKVRVDALYAQSNVRMSPLELAECVLPFNFR